MRIISTGTEVLNMASLSDPFEQLCEGVDALVVTPPPTPVPTSPPARYREQSVAQIFQSPSRPRVRQSIRYQVRGKRLFGKSKKTQPPAPVWSKAEESRLIEFMLIFTEGKSWVMHKHTPFWNEAGKHFQRCLKTIHCRSGTGIVVTICIVCAKSVCHSGKNVLVVWL